MSIVQVGGERLHTVARVTLGDGFHRAGLHQIDGISWQVRSSNPRERRTPTRRPPDDSLLHCVLRESP